MKLELSEDVQQSIQRHVESGGYSSPEDVVRAAIDQLDEYEDTVSDIRQSFDDERAGRIHSLKDVDAELRKKHGFEPRA
jgi:Arc/MetJ-type ribon-helix-helix transcriptional regulator